MLHPDPEIQQLITYLGLQPLPFEGGWFSQTYRSPYDLEGPALPAGYPSSRPLGTAIYYLMTPAVDGFSALHRLRGVEILHFYLGDPVESLLLFPDGSSREIILGQDILHSQVPQLVIPPQTWQGHRVCPGGRYALIGSTMSPGYDDADFVLGDRTALRQAYPDRVDRILYLTRE